MTMRSKYEVHWRALDDDGDDGWHQLRCLYAYFAPRITKPVYFGKAWGKTVRERWHRAAKSHFWDDLERERGIFRHCVHVGTVALYENERLTHRLVRDLESLMIFRLQPWGNIQSARSCTLSRSDFIISHHGDWPLKQRRFDDRD